VPAWQAGTTALRVAQSAARPRWPDGCAGPRL